MAGLSKRARRDALKHITEHQLQAAKGGKGGAIHAAIAKAFTLDVLLDDAPLAILYDEATNRARIVKLDKDGVSGVLRVDGEVVWEQGV